MITAGILGRHSPVPAARRDAGRAPAFPAA